MKNLRQQIDRIDQKIIELLGKRKKLAKEIAKFKKTHDLPIRDEKREEKLKNHLKDLAEKHQLDPVFVSRLYDQIFKESRRIQEG